MVVLSEETNLLQQTKKRNIIILQKYQSMWRMGLAGLERYTRVKLKHFGTCLTKGEDGMHVSPTSPYVYIIKSVLGRVRNNIHEVLRIRCARVASPLKWVLYKLHVSVARAGDGSWPPARVGHGSNDIHKTTACTTPCTSHLETHPRDVSHAQRSTILCVCCCVLSLIHS